MDVCAVILAAGKGSRMKSKYHKAVHKVCGKEMINIIIDKLNEIDINDINVIIGENRQNVIDAIKDRKVSYSIQDNQMGTGHAVIQSRDFLCNKNGVVLIFACDMPLIDKENIKKLIDKHKKENNNVTILTSIVENGLSYGRIIRENGNIKCIREAKDCSSQEILINEINTSIYCFNISDLLLSLDDLKNNNSQNEFYLTDVIEIIFNNGGNINSLDVDNLEVLGIDSREQLEQANEILRNSINKYHLNNGVTILDSKSTYIDINVKIGKDVIIYPNVYLYGNTEIGDDCKILPNTRIENSVILEKCIIESSVICDSFVGKNTSIGPFAYLRPKTKVLNNVKIGNFVEVKNSIVGNNTKVPHLSYVGDSDIGENCNLGCGVITVNYNGKDKNRTVIKDNCFVGCNSNLIAPVIVESNSYIAAGTTVIKKVTSKSLAIGRVRQKNIENWVDKK